MTDVSRLLGERAAHSQGPLFHEERQGRIPGQGPVRPLRPGGRVIAAAERKPQGPASLGPDVLRGHDGPRFPAQQPDPDRRRPGHVPERLLRPADRGLDGVHLRHGQERGPRPQGGRRDGFRLQPPAAEGELRPEDPGRRLRPGLVPQGHRRRDRGRQAGRDAPRGQHGHPPGRPSRHRGIHPDEEGRQERRQLQHLRRRHRRLHGGGQEGDVLRHRRSLSGRRSSTARTPARSSG